MAKLYKRKDGPAGLLYTRDGSPVIDQDSAAWQEALKHADCTITLRNDAPADDNAVIKTLDDLDLTPPTPVITGFAYGGQVSLLHGKPGSGKSTLARQGIRSVVTGEPFLGKPVFRGSVLLYAVDEGIRHAVDTMINRMKFPLDDEGNCLVYVKDHVPPVDMAGEWLEQNLDKHPDIRLVVIDTLQTFFSLRDVNDNSEVDRALQGLRSVANSHPDTAFVLIHHAGKSGGYMGATTISGKVDLMYRMEKDEGAEGINHLVNEKHRTIAAQPKMILRWDPETWLYTPADSYRTVKESEREGDRKQRITEALRQHANGLRKRALHDLIKGKWATFDETLNAMVKDGTVNQQEDLYLLPNGE